MAKLLISDFILIAPGILSFFLFNRFASRNLDSSIKFILETFLFSSFNYILVFLVSFLTGFFDAPITLILSANNDKLDFNYSLSVMGWSLVILFSFLLPTLICLWNKNSWDLKYWGYSPGHTPWDDAFDKAIESEWHVIVYRKEGEVIYGWPRYASDKEKKKELFLTKALTLNESKKGPDLLYDPEDHNKRQGVLLSIEDGDKIEFVTEISNKELQEEYEQKQQQRE